MRRSDHAPLVIANELTAMESWHRQYMGTHLRQRGNSNPVLS